MDEDKVLAAIAAIQASMDAFRGEVVAKFERVEDTLTSIKADISVVSFSAMRAVKRSESDREELRDLSEMVNKMWTSVLRMKTDIEELQKKKQ